jgi:F-type H+-transporting ATPase subunit epsilon
LNVKILLPSEVFFKGEAAKLTAEAVNGSFCLLPKHVDFVSAVVPGILIMEDAKGKTVFFAIDQGVLVKKGDEVFVSTRNAFAIPDLGKGREIVEEKFKVIDDREKTARAAAYKLEADMVRRLMEIKGNA